MGRHHDEHRRHKVVSMRLRDDEWKNLYSQCRKARMNMSEFLRETVLSLNPGLQVNKES